MSTPTIETERLVLRPFTREDAAAVRRLAGDREVAATTMHLPHPYPEGAAESWIDRHAPDYAAGRGVVWAITRREGDSLVGAVGLTVDPEMRRGELGYWIGREEWGRGWATEAARAAVRFGFEVLRLDRIVARHLASNPASGAVMRKLGMQAEGTLRRHVLKWGERHDVVVYGLLREEWRP